VPPVQFSGESWEKIKVIYQAQTPQTKGVIKAVGAGTIAVATVMTPIPLLIGFPVAAWMGFSSYKSLKED
jgi:ABC-type spermidine/putrescine transport system permease subunit I